MTLRQRVLAAMRRTTLPDRCPFEISWGVRAEVPRDTAEAKLAVFVPGRQNPFN